MAPKTLDITDVLFPASELTPEEKRVEERKCFLLSKAEADARKNLEGRVPFSPIALVDEVQKLYHSYLDSEGLEYEGARGV